MSEKRTSSFAIKTTYTKHDVTYACPAIDEAVTLDCFWYLDADQGAEGFLSPCSSRVQCSAADRCPVLANRRCPLSDVHQDVLNELEVRVLEGQRWLRLEDDHTVSEVGEAQAAGRVIWFGATTVIGKDGAHGQPWE